MVCWFAVTTAVIYASVLSFGLAKTFLLLLSIYYRRERERERDLTACIHYMQVNLLSIGNYFCKNLNLFHLSPFLHKTNPSFVKLKKETLGEKSHPDLNKIAMHLPRMHHLSHIYSQSFHCSIIFHILSLAIVI